MSDTKKRITIILSIIVGITAIVLVLFLIKPKTIKTLLIKNKTSSTITSNETFVIEHIEDEINIRITEIFVKFIYIKHL